MKDYRLRVFGYLAYVMGFAILRLGVSKFITVELLLIFDVFLYLVATVFAYYKVECKKLMLMASIVFFVSELALYNDMLALDNALTLLFISMVVVLGIFDAKALKKLRVTELA